MRTASQTNWHHQFPGTSIAITSMRDSLTAADWTLRWHEADFKTFDRNLRLTGLPLFLWNPETLRIYKFIYRRYRNAQKLFQQALRFIQWFSRSQKSEKNFPQPNQCPSPVPPSPVEPSPLQWAPERHFYGKHT